MDYKMLLAKTHEKVLNENDKVDFFNSVMDHPFNKKQLKMYEEELDYFETIEKILNRIESHLKRWYELLKTDGINSKLMVANDIQNILKEIEQDEKD